MRSLLAALVLASSSFAQETISPPTPAPLDKAIGKMTFPKGFKVTLCAGEPDIVQPMHMAIDHRGRVWVVECMSYPKWDPETVVQGRGKDRILIFEDTDNDGKFDSRKVFYEGGRNFTSIAFGTGGVYVISLPELVFIKDGNNDDKADGDPEVKLDGFSLKAKHNVANNLTWGPDGWLWGLHGILETSHIGKPNAAQKDRAKINCGVWRYHPTKELVEVVCHGTTNPYGLDFDQYGEAFITNCVIKHLFHVIPGAHYKRMHGQDFNPYLYGLMDSIADHYNWVGQKWQDSRGGKEHDKAGGGHAHAGCMIYQGDQWPKEYRGRLFTCNIHGKRINTEILEQKGSGYLAKKGPDFLKANDEWFRGVCLKQAPDGGVYVLDWCDAGECHDAKHCDKKTGRIYKITYGKPFDPTRFATTEIGAPEFNRAMKADNVWYFHRLRWLIQTGQRKKFDNGLVLGPQENPNVPRMAMLARELMQGNDEVLALRGFWVLWDMQANGWARGVARLDAAMQSKHPSIRSWAIRFACETYTWSVVKPGKEREPHSIIQSALQRVARNERNPRVRLTLASVLQKLPTDLRLSIARRLVAWEQDKDDPNLPLMLWYGIEPLVADDFLTSTKLLKASRIPLLRKNIARRAAEGLK